jgi:hypothetical protein
VAKPKKGKKMTRIGSYDIVAREGRKRRFRGTLLKTFNIRKLRLAIFSVPKPKRKKKKE